MSPRFSPLSPPPTRSLLPQRPQAPRLSHLKTPPPAAGPLAASGAGVALRATVFELSQNRTKHVDWWGGACEVTQQMTDTQQHTQLGAVRGRRADTPRPESSAVWTKCAGSVTFHRPDGTPECPADWQGRGGGLLNERR